MTYDHTAGHVDFNQLVSG